MKKTNYQPNKPLHMTTDDGSYEVDPRLDPEGYRNLLRESANHRQEGQNAATDAFFSSLPDGARQESQDMSLFGRMQSSAAMNGFNRQWAPFFESLNVVGENSGSHRPAHLNTGSLDLPMDNPTNTVGDPTMMGGPSDTLHSAMAGMAPNRQPAQAFPRGGRRRR